MPMRRLLYRSDEALSPADGDIRRQVSAIVAKAAAANAASGITGALLLGSGIFVQALEGPADAIERTFERICRDLRHRNVRLLEIAEASERAFGDWTMVEVRSPVDIAGLCPALDVFDATRFDMSAAGAIVQAMRTLLLANCVAGRPEARSSGR